MISISYSYSNGEKHTFIFDDLQKANTKFQALLKECVDNQITITVKTKFQ